MADLFDFNLPETPKENSGLFSFDLEDEVPISEGGPRITGLSTKAPAVDPYQVRDSDLPPEMRRKETIQYKEKTIAGKVKDALGTTEDLNAISDIIFSENDDTRRAKAKNIYAMSNILEIPIEKAYDEYEPILESLGLMRDVSTEEMASALFLGSMAIASGISILPAGPVLLPSMLKGLASYKAVAEAYDLSQTIFKGKEYKFLEDRNIIEDNFDLDMSNRLIRGLVAVGDMAIKGYGAGKANQASRFLKKAWMGKGNVPDLYVPEEYFKEAKPSPELTNFKNSVVPYGKNVIFKVDLTRPIPKDAVPMLRLDPKVDLRLMEKKLAKQEIKQELGEGGQRALPKAESPSDELIQLDVHTPFDEQLPFYRMKYEESLAETKKLFDFRDPKDVMVVDNYDITVEASRKAVLADSTNEVLAQVEEAPSGDHSTNLPESGTYDDQGTYKKIFVKLPEWISDRGFTKKTIVGAIKKGMSGKGKLGKNQQQIYGLFLKEAEGQYRRNIERWSGQKDLTDMLTPEEVDIFNTLLESEGLPAVAGKTVSTIAPKHKANIVGIEHSNIPEGEINRIAKFATDLGVKISKIEIVPEEVFVDPSTPEGYNALIEQGFTKEIIANAKDEGEIFQLKGTHGIFGSGSGRLAGSDIRLYKGHSELTYYEEIAHAIADQGGIPNWHGTAEEQAKFIAGEIAGGREGKIVELTQKGSRVDIEAPWEEGVVKNSIVLKGSDVEITAGKNSELVQGKGINTTPKADHPVKRADTRKTKLADMLPNGVLEPTNPSPVIKDGYYKGKTRNWMQADLISKAMREGNGEFIDIGGSLFYIPKDKTLPAYRHGSPLKELNAKLRTYIFDIPAVYTCKNCVACKGTCYAVGAQVMYPAVKLGRFANLALFMNHRADLRARIDADLLKNTYSAVRIHSSGDIISQQYIDFWDGIIKDHPSKTFYTYSKVEGLDYSKINKRKNFNLVPSELPDGGLNYGPKEYMKAKAKEFGLKECPADIRKIKYEENITKHKGDANKIAEIRTDFNNPDKAIFCAKAPYKGRGKGCQLCMVKDGKTVMFLEKKSGMAESADAMLEETRNTDFQSQLTRRSIEKVPDVTTKKGLAKQLKLDAVKIRDGKMKIEDSTFLAENLFDQAVEVARAERDYLKTVAGVKKLTIKQQIKTTSGGATPKEELTLADNFLLGEYLKKEVGIAKKHYVEGKRESKKDHKAVLKEMAENREKLGIKMITEASALKGQIRMEAQASRLAYKQGRIDKAYEHKMRQLALLELSTKRKLAKQINAEIPDSVDLSYHPLIEALQRDVDTGFVSEARWTKRENIKEFLQRNPEAKNEMSEKILKDIYKKPLEGYSVKTLEEIKATIDSLKKKGKILYKNREGARKARINNVARNMIDNIMGEEGGVTYETGPKLLSNEKRKNYLYAVDSFWKRPWALFEQFDGFKQGSGPMFQKFFNDTNDKIGAQLRLTDQREWKMSKVMDELKIHSSELAEKTPILGNHYTTDELMGIYAMSKNPFAKHTVTYGNEISPKAQELAIKALAPKYKKLADAVIIDYAKHLPRLQKVYGNNTNKALILEQYYVALQSKILNDLPPAEQVGLEADHANYLKALLDRGMTVERKDIPEVFQEGVNLRLMEVWQNQVKKHEAYMNMSEHIRDLNGILSNKDVIQAVKTTDRWIGIEHLKAIQENVNRTANHQFYKGQGFPHEMSKFLRQSTALHYLAGNVPSMLRQFPSLAFYAPYAGWGNIGDTLKLAMTPPPMKTITVKGKKIKVPDWDKSEFRRMWDMVRELDPQVLHRMQEREMVELAELSDSQFKQLRKQIGDVGLAGIRAIDGAAITLGWYSTFIANLHKGSDYAIQQARNVTLMTQPQFHPKDLAQMYDSGEFMNWALQFTNQLNATANVGYTGQIGAIKNKDYRWAISNLVAVMLSGVYIWSINNQRFPDSLDDLKESQKDNIAIHTPLFGKNIVQKRKGYDAGINMFKSIDMLYGVGSAVLGDEATIGETALATADALGLMTGLYGTGAKRLGNTVKYMDMRELMGQPPK